MTQTPRPHRLNDLLQWERRRFPLLLTVLAVTVTSALTTHLAGGHGVWQQWTWLLHVLGGSTLVFLLGGYLLTHLSRTLVMRRLLTASSGLLAGGALVWLAASGLTVLLLGQRETLRWLYQAHVWTGLGLLGLLGLHLLLHFTTPRAAGRPAWASVPATAPLQAAIGLTAGAGAVLLATWGYSALPTPAPQSVQPYALSYGDHPFRPSQTETVSGDFVPLQAIAGSAGCGRCHETITREWMASLHGQAASDPAYEKNVGLLAEVKGIAATRYCEGCHAPVALLTGTLTPGGNHGGQEGTPANLEGVSCLSCHGIDRVEHVKGVASYRFAPARPYLFTGHDQGPGRWLHDLLVRIRPDAHRADLARPVLNDPRMCATCHAQFMDRDVNDWGWVKMQDDYSAWLNSPYSGQGEHTFAHEALTRCQDCHMPAVTARDPSATASGQVRSHRFPGANTAIPFVTGDQEQLEITRDFLRTGRVRVTVEEPRRTGATRSDLSVAPDTLGADGQAAENQAPGGRTPTYLYLGEEARLRVLVSNDRVGHNFPGGTTDINQVWVHFRVVDGENRPVYESGALREDGQVEPSAHFYRSVPVDRHGHHVWKHDLFNMVGDAYFDVIPAGETDVLEYSFPVPWWAKSPLTASAVVRYRKLDIRYARWALDDPDLELPIVDMARHGVVIPVRRRPAVENHSLTLDGEMSEY
ncbi:MAG: multiheme c-type cytochrome [Candidatus Competibacteraceae bacterium]|nr:multiheme c-type cytochrome [Candidatus Competibacteraceae bacterium]